MYTFRASFWTIYEQAKYSLLGCFAVGWQLIVFVNSTYQNHFINDATPEGLTWYNNNFLFIFRKSSQDTNNLIMDLFVCIQPTHDIHTQRELPQRWSSVPHPRTHGQVALAGNVYFVLLF